MNEKGLKMNTTNRKLRSLVLGIMIVSFPHLSISDARAGDCTSVNSNYSLKWSANQTATRKLNEAPKATSEALRKANGNTNNAAYKAAKQAETTYSNRVRQTNAELAAAKSACINGRCPCSKSASSGTNYTSSGRTGQGGDE